MTAPRRPGSDRLEAAFAAGDRGPDLTRVIMGRLGYMPVSPRVARRRSVRRWARRAVTVVLGIATVFVGMRIHDQGPDVRRPEGPTVPSALGHDLDRHQRQMQRTFQTIRRIVPVPADAPRLSEDVERSGLGPVRWM